MTIHLQRAPSRRASRLARTLALAACVAAPCLAVHADLSPADTAAERAAIAAERRNIDTWDAAARAECFQRFVVTSCLEEVHAQRQARLKAVTERELVLDDTVRRQRAQQRMARIEATAARRAASGAGPEPLVAPADLQAPADPPPAGAASAAPAPRPLPAPKASVSSAADRQARAARAQAEQRARAAQIAQRKQNVEARRAARQQSGKPPAKPLPPVDAASAP